MRLGYDIYLCERVKELLDEGTLDQIIAQVQKDLDGEWKTTAPQDSTSRELIYHEIHALSRIQIRMNTLITELRMVQEERLND